MRLNRSLMTGLALLTLVPATGRAQEGRLFNNSWFWGAGGGALTYWTATTAHSQAPTVSLDWLLTRTHYALYLGFDQAFFTARNLTYTDVGRFFTDTTLTTSRDIEYFAQAKVRNSRHLQAALLAFPGSGHLRPYGGIGISANFVQGSVTTSAPPALTPAAQWFPNFFEDQFRMEAADWISPVLMGGLQAQLSRFSIYGQVKLFPGNAAQFHQRFFTDQGFFMLQAGLRINALNSIGSW